MQGNRVSSCRVAQQEVLSAKLTNKNNHRANALLKEDTPFHNWYRFVLSFPPHLVREYTSRFGANESDLVLDPFCGTGTTGVECKKLGIPSVGLEANPIAYFASRTKVNWNIDAESFIQDCQRIAKVTTEKISAAGISALSGLPLFGPDDLSKLDLRDLTEDQWKILSRPWISPVPLHRTLELLSEIRRIPREWTDHQELALASALVSGIGNVRFGPEIGATKPKDDAPVIALWLEKCDQIYEDLSNDQFEPNLTEARVERTDTRQSLPVEDSSVSVVITSPPYPNEKDYTRTTRLESVILGHLANKKDLRALKEELLRSNTRNVYKVDDDDKYVQEYESVSRLSDEIEKRRIELGKTSGFERLYHRVVPLYFGGMKRHLISLKRVLRPNAHLAYVVGDQMSYFRVHIKTGEILAEIAESVGYEVESIDLWRERLATATKTWLREEVVVLST